MNTHKDFFDKPLYTIPNYIYNLLLGSIYFLICNPLLIFFYIVTFIDAKNFNFLFLFISLVPLGPSLTALYLSMSKLCIEKSLSISSYFFYSYKKNFKDSMKLWLIQLSVLLILSLDFFFFYIRMPKSGIHIIFFILGIYLLIVGLYAFPINSRFEMKLTDLIILSFYYTLKKFPITLFKTIVIGLVFKLSSYIPELLFILSPSIICLLFAYYDEPILKEIEAKQ